MRKLTVLLLSFLLCAPFFASADTNLLTAPSVTPIVGVSQVSLDKTSYAQGDQAEINFTITDTGSGDAAGLSYRVALVGGLAKDSIIPKYVFGSQSAGGTIYLKSGQSQSIQAIYDLSNVPSDPALGLEVTVFSQTGIPVGWGAAHFTMTGNTLPSLQPINGSVSLNGSTYLLQEGPTVKVGETLNLKASFYNPSTETFSIIPQVVLAGISTTTEKAVSMKAGATSTLSFALPTTGLRAGTYIAEVTFPDTAGRERATEFDVKYSIDGDTASIVGVSTDTQFPISIHQPFNLLLTATGRPFNVNELTGTPVSSSTLASTTPVVADIHTTLYDENNAQVFSSVETGETLTSEPTTFTIPVTLKNSASALTADIEIVEGTTTLASYKGQIGFIGKPISPEAKETIFTNMYFDSGLALILILLIGSIIFAHRRRKAVVILPLFILVFSLHSVFTANAQSFVQTGGTDAYYSGSYVEFSLMNSPIFSNTSPIELAIYSFLVPAPGGYISYWTNLDGGQAQSGTAGLSSDAYVGGYPSAQINFSNPGAGNRNIYISTQQNPYPGATGLSSYYHTYTMQGYIPFADTQYVAPVPPSNVQAACTVDGTGVTLTWNAQTDPSTAYLTSVYDVTSAPTSTVVFGRGVSSGITTGLCFGNLCAEAVNNSTKITWYDKNSTMYSYDKRHDSGTLPPGYKISTNSLSLSITPNHQYGFDAETTNSMGTSAYGTQFNFTCSTTKPCTGPDGTVIQSGSSMTYYSTSTSPTCSVATQVRTCTNGVLSGTATYQYGSCASICQNGAANYSACTVDASGKCLNGDTNPQACTISPSCSNGATNPTSTPPCTICPLGTTLVSGTCVANCTNGANNPIPGGGGCNACPLGQTYTGGSCQNDCTSVNMTAGQSKVYYSLRTATPTETCTANSQVRTCSNGSLTGNATYQYTSCSPSYQEF